MRRLGTLCLTVIFATVVATSCGRGNSDGPVVPGDQLRIQNEAEIVWNDNRHVWGFWDVNISEDRLVAEIVPIRAADMHLNVVRMLEITPCDHCLTIGNLHLTGPNELEADLTLTHPFPGLLKYTGFDVRGIFIAQTDFTFPVSGRKIALGDSVPRMLNPDGYTPLFNPTEFPPTTPAALGYIPGKHATGGDLSATLNPFVAYKKDAPRRMFEAGGAETRTVKLHAPTGPIHFGYAVDACWELVPHEIVDPVVDFPPDANCLEAYAINVNFPYDLESSWMSQNLVYVEVFDHQGLETISSVTVEAFNLFSGEIPLTYSTQTGEESWLFSGMVINETAAVHGAYPALVRVVDTNPDQNLGVIDAWTASTTRVKQGWARTWQGADYSTYGCARATAVDGSGNIYVTGCFRGTVDFDPGPGEDIHNAPVEINAYLTKFDPTGNFLWVRTWGGPLSYDYGNAVSVDDMGNVYVAGDFTDGADFDPGPGNDYHMSHGGYDAFISRFDSGGNFVWARTWGGTEWDIGSASAIDSSGNIYVTGLFSGTSDFDPGPNEDNHTADIWGNAYLTKISSAGDFLWARTWGGINYDVGNGAAVDDSENVYVTGYFDNDNVDFDPGSGIDVHPSHGLEDVYLSKFNSGGDYIWARTWGGPADERGNDVAVDSYGCANVIGYFEGTMDFDPGTGIDDHASNGSADAFVSKFNPDGSFVWARTWGGVEYEPANGIAINGAGNIFVTGAFAGIVDFDPGPGTDNHGAIGYSKAFLTKFDSGGSFVWAKDWGGEGSCYGAATALDNAGDIYVTGSFWKAVDFDPGPGIDNQLPGSDWDEQVFLSKFLPDGNW